MFAALMQIIIRDFPITTGMIRWSYHYRNLDASKARRELEWKPATPFEEAVKQTISHYKKFGIFKIAINHSK